MKNAIEYSFSNGLIIINSFDNQLYTQIEIKDFGKGMTRYDLLNIFKRFYKGKNSQKNSIGIGLPLAKLIIEKDNGKIFVKSKLNEGTIFQVKYYFKKIYDILR